MKLGKLVKWVLIGIVVILVGSFALILAFPEWVTGPTAPPLQLPALDTAASNTTPVSLDGTWVVGSGSVAGFRVEESFLVQKGTIVGRSNAVTGSLVISNNEAASGSFQVDLSKLTMGGKVNPSFTKLMDTKQYPNATLTITEPIALTSIPSSGQTVTLNATGSLSLKGISHPVTFTFSGQYDGSVLEAVGSAPVLASDWGIDSPFGIHDNDLIEFLVVLQKQ
jgi:polyisoprenoid-binding protein YceI